MNLTDVVVIDPHGDEPALDVLVHFGLVTGRRATKAEVERLAHTLLEKVPSVAVSIVERYDLTRDGTTACTEQVRVAVPGDAVDRAGYDFATLSELVAALARAWALECRELPPEGDLSLAERLAPRTVSLD